MAHILIIDDEALLREFMRDTLEEAGHIVVEAGNGSEGIDAAQRLRPDLVITDIIMPEMEGIELIISLQDLTHSLPIIAMSGGGRGLGTQDFLETAKEIGVQQTLSKPFHPDELVAAVNNALVACVQP